MAEKRGNIWYTNIMLGAKRIRESLGKGSTKEDAELREAQLRIEFNDRKLKRIPDYTMEQAMLKYINEHVNVSLEKPDKVLSHIRSMQPYYKGELLRNIHKIANKVKLQMKKKGLSASTIQKRISILRYIANIAYNEWEWLVEPLGMRIKAPSPDAAREIYLTHDQVNSLSAACRGCDSGIANDIADLVVFAAYTGLRFAELERTMPACKFHSSIVVEGKKGASHFNRSVPLEPEIEAIFDRIFPLKFNYDQMSKVFTKARKICKLEHVRFHDLRHTFGSWLAQAGRTEPEIMALMGHKTSAQSRRYITFHVSHLRDKMPTFKGLLPQNCHKSSSTRTARVVQPIDNIVKFPDNSVGRVADC